VRGGTGSPPMAIPAATIAAHTTPSAAMAAVARPVRRPPGGAVAAVAAMVSYRVLPLQHSLGPGKVS
jgi:hypothetical protein